MASSPSSQASVSTPPSAPDTVRFPMGEIDASFVKRFREQIHALGAVWIFWGCVTLALSLILEKLSPQFAVSGGLQVLNVALGLIWLVVGVYALDKRLLALQVGRVLGYLSLAFTIGMWVEQAAQKGSNPSMPVFQLMIGVYVLRQCHRVLRWGNQMQKAGVPLTLRPSR